MGQGMAEFRFSSVSHMTTPWSQYEGKAPFPLPDMTQTHGMAALSVLGPRATNVTGSWRTKCFWGPALRHQPAHPHPVPREPGTVTLEPARVMMSLPQVTQSNLETFPENEVKYQRSLCSHHQTKELERAGEA